MFREYDIRGQIDQPNELTEEAIDAIGRGFAVFLHKRGIGDAIIGHDSRAHSAKVKDITVKALLESGINVIEIGQVLTPIFYFSQYELKKKGGVMITASHNPGKWSGFKHAYDYSVTLNPDDIKELYDAVTAGAFLRGNGAHETHEGIIEAYTRDILSRVKIAKRLRVLVDTANGTAGPIVPEMLRRAGCEVIEQYTNLSEERHHAANPSTLEMLEAMQEGARHHEVDIALGFDEDGDRLGVVSEKGEIVWSDQVLMLLSRPLLAAYPGAKIVFDVKCTQALFDEIPARGGVPVMWKTGHSYIKTKAKEVDAALAGERSGHFFFRKGHYGFDDAPFAALKLLEYLSHESKPLSQLVAELPRYFTSPVWHAPCADEKKYAVIEQLVREFKQEYGVDKVIDINGARVYLEDGWGLVRASSNIPMLVLVFEAKTGEGLKKIESAFREKLSHFPEVGSEWVSG